MTTMTASEIFTRDQRGRDCEDCVAELDTRHSLYLDLHGQTNVFLKRDRRLVKVVVMSTAGWWLWCRLVSKACFFAKNIVA